MTLCVGLSHTQDVIIDAVSFAERFKYTYLVNLPAGRKLRSGRWIFGCDGGARNSLC